MVKEGSKELVIVLSMVEQRRQRAGGDGDLEQPSPGEELLGGGPGWAQVTGGLQPKHELLSILRTVGKPPEAFEQESSMRFMRLLFAGRTGVGVHRKAGKPVRNHCQGVGKRGCALGGQVTRNGQM